MLCEGLSRIFTIKSIRLLNNVKLHEYVIHRLKIPRPPAVPVQARLRVPERGKAVAAHVCGGLFSVQPPAATAPPAVWQGGHSAPGGLPAPVPSAGGDGQARARRDSVRNGVEDARDPAGAAVQAQRTGKAVLHLQHGLVPQGQCTAARREKQRLRVRQTVDALLFPGDGDVVGPPPQALAGIDPVHGAARAVREDEFARTQRGPFLKSPDGTECRFDEEVLVEHGVEIAGGPGHADGMLPGRAGDSGKEQEGQGPQDPLHVSSSTMFRRCGILPLPFRHVPSRDPGGAGRQCPSGRTGKRG